MDERVYYNEIDPFAASWLRELISARLIPAGIVDERDIRDVRPDDLNGFDQCHFFAGIGGWAYALDLAGWPREQPVWTGSCPCQPFSSASRGRGKRLGCDRHLWPQWRSLINECEPRTVFGEQVFGAFDWVDEVCRDLENLGYTFRAEVLPAWLVGADHARERIYFKGDADRDRKSSRAFYAKACRVPRGDRQPGRVVLPYGVSQRVALLRAFGNAIVPQVAAEFIQACM